MKHKKFRPHKTRAEKPNYGKSRYGRDKAGFTKKARTFDDNAPRRIVGIARPAGTGWVLFSTNRRDKGEFTLHVKDATGLEDGLLVLAEQKITSKWRAKEARLLEVLGHPDSPKAVSLIAIATHDIPMAFNPEAVAEANAARPVTLDGRTDLRDVPLVTIDGEDARDFDDAVFAEADKDGGWHLVVAIADVAHYVKAGNALDKDAFKRGNSTYFPDRVVPMLPEALSNELCSLKPNVERATMAVHLWIDKAGELTRWEFVRGVMRSRARLTYNQVQAAMDGKPDDLTAPLLDPVIKPLYAAYRCLIAARLKRGTLELDLPERKVEIDEKGRVKSVTVRARFDSHKLIEEFMILANVAAAAQLEGKGGLCIYRIHDKPSEEKLDALRNFLDSIGISLVPHKQLHSRFLTQILDNAAGTEHAQVVNEVMLRSQAQAVYSPDNIGHFGLALAKYAHFTSPIRRYADLIVHRGLIRACQLGKDGLTEKEIETLQDIAEHISTTERRSAMAERDSIDRFMTLFLADHVGATFPAKISGVARFGLFARLDATGADGIIPIENLPSDYYFHDEKRHALVGRRTKAVYQLAQPVTVRIDKADRLTGSLSLSLVDAADKPVPRPTGKRPRSKPAGNPISHQAKRSSRTDSAKSAKNKPKKRKKNDD